MNWDDKKQTYSAGVTAVVRITLRDGTYHDDIGFAAIENVPSKGAALGMVRSQSVYTPISQPSIS